VCGLSLAGIAGSNPAMGMDVSECCVLSDRGLCIWLIRQRSTTECGGSECDREGSRVRRPWPAGGCRYMRKKYIYINLFIYLPCASFNHQIMLNSFM
jgi:hypothetical protein